jgi:hypothetical protein
MPPSNEEALFVLALTKPAAGRAAWLDRECGEDKALRARLDALLAAHEKGSKRGQKRGQSRKAGIVSLTAV